MRMILSRPSPASWTRTPRHHGPGSLIACKAPHNFVLVKQIALRDCKLRIPTHCKLPCLNLTHPLSVSLAWLRHRLCHEKKSSALELHLAIGLSVQALSAS